MKYYQENIKLRLSPHLVFNYIDDHTNLSSHMERPSLMMGGGSMSTKTDDKNGKAVGSHIFIEGKAFGMRIFLEEVVTKYAPPYIKEWETVGSPNLLVIGNYKMRIYIKSDEGNSILVVSIKYDLPTKNKWLGVLFSKIYAKWCVKQVLKGVRYYEEKSIK